MSNIGHNTPLEWSQYDFTQIPFDDLVSVGQRTMLYRDLFTVSWLLGRFCNYSCSYCWPYASSRKKDHRPIDLILMTIDEIKRQARDNGYNSFHFSFSGGEPTFHPDYLEIIQYLADDIPDCNYHSIHMTSNCSRKMKWFEEYAKIASNFHRASITASCHREHVDTDAKMKDFADKLIYCQEQDIQITINQVMLPDKFGQCWEDALFFHDLGINVTLKPQSDPTASFVVDGYTPEMLEKLHNGMPQRGFTDIKKKIKRPRPKQILDLRYETTGVPQHMQVEFEDKHGKKWYMDQAERFNAFNFNRFRGWTCESGYRSIIIREPDGSIKRSYSCSDEPLGYIDKGFKLFDRPMPCITDTCVSSADSKIPKRRRMPQT